MVNGILTRCRSCGCILYLNEEAEKLMQPTGEAVDPTMQDGARGGDTGALL